MAQKRAEPEDKLPEVPATGLMRTVGVGLKASEIELIDKIGQEHGVARNAIVRFAVRHFLAEYMAGLVKLPVEQTVKNRLKFPKP